MKTRIVIDGDIPIYQLASTHQTEINWDSDDPAGGVTIETDLEGAKEGFKEYMDMLFDELKSDDMLIALSDPEKNFRKVLNPSYKANRKNVKRPLLLKPLREWVEANYKTKVIPWLEADDVCGIEATKNHEEEVIVVSIDKDMQTIPGCKWYNPVKKTLHSISSEVSMRALYKQALMGDAVDGYSGIPGIGPKKAEKMIEYLFKDEQGWEDYSLIGPFIKYVDLYIKHIKEGDPYELAMLNLNMATILTTSEYKEKYIDLFPEVCIQMRLKLNPKKPKLELIQNG